MSEGRKIVREKYIYWKDEDMWLGYLEEYPDYKDARRNYRRSGRSLKRYL